MTRVKICGCMKIGDAVAAAEAGADFIGIMFAEKSRRRVSPEEAALIVRAVGTPLGEMEQDDPPPLHRLHGDPAAGHAETNEAWFSHGAEALDRLLSRKRPLVVGVFEDQDIEEVNEIADEAGIDVIQLAGSEPWSDALLANRQAIQVLRPRPGMTAAEIEAYIEPGAALAFMLDPSKGSGVKGDWAAAAAVAAKMPIWLAGGLSPENVADAIETVRPWAVDVSSGVETGGVKDAGKIAAFVRAVRSTDRGAAVNSRTDRSLDLSRSSSTKMPERGRRSSPRMVGFPYHGGYRYHLVFTTKSFKAVLRDDWAELAVSELHTVAAATGFSLEAYCVMPDHVHVLVAGDAELDSDLKGFAHRFKQALGYRFKQATGSPLWHRSYYDHVVRDQEPMIAHLAYILANPVTAGLVETPDAWRFSGPQNALEEVSAALVDRSKDLSVRVAQLTREFGGHASGGSS